VDGSIWSQPIDIFYFPGGGGPFTSPKAVVDERGVIHFVGLGGQWPNAEIYYSFADAGKDIPNSANAWQAPVSLAEGLTGSEYSIDLAYEAPQTLHILFARGITGETFSGLRSVAYMRSTDGGVNWSSPIDLWTSTDPQQGANAVRLLVVNPGKVYAVWAEWNIEGNGEAVYFARSLDSGQTWESPTLLAERAPGDYERDWPNLASLGENQLAVVWEGGPRAYHQAMYSDDGGLTWSAPDDIFPELIGENGFAELVYDSAGQLHLFVAKRGRSGLRFNSTTKGLYHSVLEGDTRWKSPDLVGGINPMSFPHTAIVGGNRFVAVYYQVNEGEIKALTGEIVGAPAVAPQPWPPLPPATPTLSPTAAQSLTEPAESIGSDVLVDTARPSNFGSNPGFVILGGLLPALILIGVFLTIMWQIKFRS